MSGVSVLRTIAAMACLVGPVKGDDDGARTSLRSTGELAVRLRQEAARLETGHASELFAALSDADTVAQLKLSAVQTTLIGELDKMGRDVQKAWLVRGLGDRPRPAPAKLAERLAEAGARLRASLVAHAEAIALEGALELSQASRLLRKVNRRAPRPLAGRYPSIAVPLREPPATDMGGFDSEIRAEAGSMLRAKYEIEASELYGIFLGLSRPGQGISMTLGLTNEQSELIRRMNQLVRDVKRDWLVRSLDSRRLVPFSDESRGPPTSKMVQRLSDSGKLVRASLVAHAEAIALEGILEPDQAAASKKRLWAQSSMWDLSDLRMSPSPGIKALLDSEVANLLRLSKGQREELVPLFENRAVVIFQLNKIVTGEKIDLLNVNGDRPETTEEQRAAIVGKLVWEARQRIAESEEDIWNVLKPAQVKAFRRLIGDSIPRRPEKSPVKVKQSAIDIPGGGASEFRQNTGPRGDSEIAWVGVWYSGGRQTGTRISL